MAKQVIGSIPEFTTDEETPSSMRTIGGDEEEKVVAPGATEPPQETPAEGPTDVGPEEKETPAAPPAEEKPAETLESESSDDTGEIKAFTDTLSNLTKAVDGLRDERKELILELKDLRGQRREVKQQEIEAVDKKIDKLEDLNPDDVTLIERILKSKGYVAKEDVDKMFYEAQKQEEISKFLKEFPEYSEENDPKRGKFGPLLGEVSLYKEPNDPVMWGVILRRAHQTVAGTKVSSDRETVAKREQIKIAGVGTGGSQRSSSVEPFSAERRQAFLAGGWSEEDIQRMEQRESS